MVAQLGLGGYFTNNIDDRVEIIKHAYKQGITFFDTSNVYGSEKDFGNALLFSPRDSFKISTKTKAKTISEVEKDFRKSCTDLFVEYIDYYFSHSAIDDMTTWNNSLEAVEFMNHLKKIGLIGKVGVSGHGTEAALEAIDSGLVDVIMVPHSISYDKFDNVIFYANRRNVEVITMKNFGSGILLGGPQRNAEYSSKVSIVDIIRYSMHVEGVSYIIPAARSIEQFYEIHRSYLIAESLGEMSQKEKHIIKNAITDFLGQDFCRFCNECRPCEVYDWKMSQPGILKAMLYQEKFGLDMTETYRSYGLNAINCDGCDNLCSRRCPFEIDIKGEMKRAHFIFTGEEVP